MTGDLWGVGRRRGGWGEGEDPADWGPPVAVATLARFVSSDPSVEEASARLLLGVPAVSAEERESVCESDDQNLPLPFLLVWSAITRGMLREERGYISPPGNWAKEVAYPVTTVEVGVCDERVVDVGGAPETREREGDMD